MADPDTRDEPREDSQAAPPTAQRDEEVIQSLPPRLLGPDLLRGILMMLMALDHTGLVLLSWPHETAIGGEHDSTPVYGWNQPIPFVIRMLTDLCAPGFFFLLGMGVTYFGESRKALMWTRWKLFRHFLIRSLVLTVTSIILGLLLSWGKIWVVNTVLIGLAVNFFIAGIVWLALDALEDASYRFGSITASNDGEYQPLLSTGSVEVAKKNHSLAWHGVNILLLVGAGVTIWWNIWLSPTHGHCKPPNDTTSIAQVASPLSGLWEFLIHPMVTDRVMSGYPPLAWVSFSLLGLLYGRMILASGWRANLRILGMGIAVLIFLFIFVLTRVFNFGNLSEGCLRMPEHIANPDRNQYLASLPSFFYMVKYPPDVAYLTFNIGGTLFFLGLLDTIPASFQKYLAIPLTFGKSALFFYVMHLFVLSSLSSIIVGPFQWLGGTDLPPGNHNPWVYAATWMLALAILYPLCKWYGQFKRKQGVDSLWRLF